MPQIARFIIGGQSVAVDGTDQARARSLLLARVAQDTAWALAQESWEGDRIAARQMRGQPLSAEEAETLALGPSARSQELQAGLACLVPNPNFLLQKARGALQQRRR